MKKFLVITWMLVLPAGVLAQEPDTLSKANEKKTHWLVGVDAYSALNGLSLIGGVEVNRNKFSLSLSHLWHSSRLGMYYDYNIIKKYRLWVGMGLHTSFRFRDFDQSKNVYKDSLIINQINLKAPEFAFLPNYGEVRNLFFISTSLTKEFNLYRGLYLTVKLGGVCCINNFYNSIGFAPLYGLQLYYKW